MLTKSDFTKIQELISGTVKVLLAEAEKRLDNKILKFKDEILGKLEKIEQDIALLIEDSRKISSHEERLLHLEEIHPDGKHPKIASI